MRRHLWGLERPEAALVVLAIREELLMAGDIVLLQTSDPYVYYEMLTATSEAR